MSFFGGLRVLIGSYICGVVGLDIFFFFFFLIYILLYLWGSRIGFFFFFFLSEIVRLDIFFWVFFPWGNMSFFGRLGVFNWILYL